MLGVPCKK